MFENILGNETNKKKLEKSIEQNRISHSYIFSGIDGIGKKLIAGELAKKVLCLEPDKKVCKCKSCIEYDSNNNPDFFMIIPEDGKIKIEKIREIQRKIAEKPIVSNKKVYIIDDAQVMTTEAQNCLLKTLEEPPEYAVLILITSNENNLLSTIKSRCTRIYFDPINEENIKKYIKDNLNIEISEKIIKLSQGSIGRIIKLSEKQEVYEKLEKIFYDMKNKDLVDIIQISDEIYKSKEEINYVLEYMNFLALELSKQDLRYLKSIKIIEETKKRLTANSNFDMCIDYMLFNIWEEVNEKNYRS